MSLYQCFIDNRLSAHFKGDQTKSILFSSKRDLREINIYFAGHPIRQHETNLTTCLKLSDEAMTSKVLKKIYAQLKFLYCQSRYGTPAYKRLLCNVLIHPHFDYGCSSCFSLLKNNENSNFKNLKRNVFIFA